MKRKESVNSAGSFLLRIMEQARISTRYKDVADKVIAEHEDLHWLDTASVSIGFLASDKSKKSKGREVLGECIKVRDLYRAYIPHEFIVVIYEPNVSYLTDEQLEILIYHELLHVGVDDTTGEPRLQIVPHDIEDFRKVIDRYGIDWSR